MLAMPWGVVAAVVALLVVARQSAGRAIATKAAALVAAEPNHEEIRGAGAPPPPPPPALASRHRDRPPAYWTAARSVNTVSPRLDRTDRCPDIRSASSLAIASPSPDPWASSAV